MTIADLVLLLTVVAAVVALPRVAYLLARGRWRAARRTALGLGVVLGLYAAVLVVVSLVSPQRVLALHEDRCFDDWCLAVERVAHPRAIGAVRARGRFYLVTVQVSSRARGSVQRARDAQVYLLDGQGRRYDPAPDAQRALDTSGAGGQPLDTELAPGGSFTRTLAFDLPPDARHVSLVVAHGLFPDLLVIGDPQSVLHKPTIVPLGDEGDRQSAIGGSRRVGTPPA